MLAEPPFGAAGGVWEIACRGAQIRSFREPDPLGHADDSELSYRMLMRPVEY
jgi:hypothetical protein